MKRSQATKILDSDIRVFYEKITEIEMGIYFSENEMINSHKKYKEQFERYGNAIPFASISINTMVTDLINKGKRNFLGSSYILNEKVMQAVIENLNLQCCWYLISAYEAYETFLIRIYSSLGFLDHKLWNCKEFGNIKINEIKTKKLSWYREALSSGTGKYNGNQILKLLRQLFPKLPDIEINNFCKDDFQFKLKFIELLRHDIVHKSGKTNLTKFIEKLFKEIGISPNVKNKNMILYNNFIMNFFENDETISKIVVINKSSFFKNYSLITLPVKRLIEVLKTHACSIYHISLLHFDKQPFWERN